MGIPLFLLVFCFLMQGLPTQSLEIPEAELDALYALRTSLDLASDWSGPLDSWKGLEIKDGHVASINIKNAHGTLPKGISAFTNITTLILGQNRLLGTIPAEIGMLRNLEYLDLHENLFVITKLDFLGQLSRLTYLDLSSLLTDQLPESIPEEWAQLSSLQHL
eukprot:TRINITY_DN1629_c1_g1_i4.p1 TRINITY_DN1629_c1_g1~~TRINITY_DN1629_c1_g1_i4.p1  ORF type:complete len:163 (-),score=12.74 TRINITY_DN1629_c1_g1_i4:166-654(-)